MAPTLEQVRAALRGPKNELSKDRLETIARGRERQNKRIPKVNQSYEFWRGNQYWYTDERGILQQQLGGPSGITAPGKTSWRVREPHNILIDIVAHEVSAATSRVPGYEVVPTTGDPEDASAAQVAQRIAIYGHDKWGIDDAAVEAVTHAVVGGEAFAWVYWDSNKGPYIEGTDVGIGDVCVEIYSGTQVFWEPGQRFEKSDWIAIDTLMTPDGAKRLDGYNFKGELVPDADSAEHVQRGYSNPERKMVMVTQYLERPTRDNPKGRWLVIANNQVICEPRDYPGDLHRL